MKRTVPIFVPLTFLILLISSCGKDNPADSDSDTYATPKTYTITGRILESGTGLSGVSVRLTGAGKDTTASTTSTGVYVFSGLPNGSYTLTPSKTNYVFNPPISTATVNAANFYAPDIAATKTSTPAPTEITFVSIPGGTFQMGNIENDINGDTGEKPLHTVTVSSFQMSDAEITNVIYCNWLNNALKSGDITATGMIVTGAKGAYSGQAYLHLSETYNADNKCWISYNNNTFSVMPGKETWPVVYVTWYGAKAFAEWYGLDLAREAEWEYACRGGRQYKYGTDDGTISKDKANYLNNGPNHPVDVKSYPKNPFGLYDMSGNVWEFCNDWWEAYASGYQTNPLGPQAGLCRVIRGGCFDFTDIGCRSAYRNGINPFLRGYNLGFRVVRRPGGLVY